MTVQEAKRRYYRAFVPAIIIFLAACLGMSWLDGSASLPPAIGYLIALVPIVALLSVFWAHWRFMNEIDEFLRSIQMQAVFFGLATILVIATGWGFLESYADAPPLGIFWLNPIFWIAYALAAGALTWRSTGQVE